MPSRESASSWRKGLTGKLGSIPRGSGRQVTYEGRPLYTYGKDRTGGQTREQGVGHVWFTMRG